MKKSLVLLIAFLFLIGGRASAEGDPTQELSPGPKKEFLIQLEKNLQASRTIQAKFTQEKHLTLFNDTLVSRGLFAFAAPDRLRWEITQPFHSLLVMNGRGVAKYDFPDGQNPHKLQFPAADALNAVLNQIVDIHQGKFEEEEKSYDIEIVKGETVIMTLIPKDPKMKRIISRIEVGFSKALDSVVSVVIRESGDNWTRIVFEDNQRNVQLPDSLFSIQ